MAATLSSATATSVRCTLPTPTARRGSPHFVSLTSSRHSLSHSASTRAPFGAIPANSTLRRKFAVSASADRPITLQIGEASLIIPFSETNAQDLDKAIDALLQTFREKEKATRPQRWQSLEFKVAGDFAAGGVFLEIFCNPNAYSSAFQARALVTVKDEKIRFTSEGALSALKAAVDEYLGRV